MFAGYATGQRIVTFSLSSLPLDIIIDKFPHGKFNGAALVIYTRFVHWRKAKFIEHKDLQNEAFDTCLAAGKYLRIFSDFSRFFIIFSILIFDFFI